MKKIIAMLSVVLFSFGVAKAGELNVTGSAKASYVITSSDGTAASQSTAPQLGIENEFTLGASGELDNGYTWSYAVDIDAVESAATNDDAKLTLDATSNKDPQISMQANGSEKWKIRNKTDNNLLSEHNEVSTLQKNNSKR